MANINTYLQFKGVNPFAGQSKMLFHSERLIKFIKTDECFPINAEINLTSFCNLHCAWCISENFTEKDSLDIDKLKEFISDYKKLGGKSLTFSGGGEPTTYKFFKEATLHSKSEGLELGLMTDGLFNPSLVPFIKQHFRWLRVSLDFTNEPKYKKWKKVDGCGQVKKNIVELCRGEGAKIGINVNVGMDYDLQDVIDIVVFFENCGADYLQFRPILPRYFKSEKTEINKVVWDYLMESFINHPKINLSLDKFEDLKDESKFPYKACEGHHFCCVLDSNGDLTTCMYHPRDNRFVFGNINTTKLEDIWNGYKRKEVKKMLRDNFDYESNCQICCKCNEINKLIDYVKYPNEDMDINFI